VCLLGTGRDAWSDTRSDTRAPASLPLASPQRGVIAPSLRDPKRVKFDPIDGRAEGRLVVRADGPASHALEPVQRRASARPSSTLKI
jgi:hypothetical protein